MEMTETTIIKSNGASKPNPSMSSKIQILPWKDPLINTIGHDPRSLYVELFWLPVLGPSCIWLLRRLSIFLGKNPAGFEIDMVVFAQELGLGAQPLKRALVRCSDFGIIHIAEDNCVYLRNSMPKLNARLLNRSSQRLRKAHDVFYGMENKTSQTTSRQELALKDYLENELENKVG